MLYCAERMIDTYHAQFQEDTAYRIAYEYNDIRISKKTLPYR